MGRKFRMPGLEPQAILVIRGILTAVSLICGPKTAFFEERILQLEPNIGLFYSRFRNSRSSQNVSTANNEGNLYYN